ncbi:MAG TPA: superoxide dismutase [Desulfosporosinus sp.]
MTYQLPKQPYPSEVLEPYYDEATVRLYHDIYYETYVVGLNKLEGKLAQIRYIGNSPLIKHWERELASYTAGHQLHSLFWQNMCPGSGGSAQGILAERITEDFGSFDNFKNQFTDAAVAAEGSGWTLLVWNPCFEELEILQAEKHQDLTQWGVIPLLIVDVWEHTYDFKYQNERACWIEACWNLVDWKDVLKRFGENTEISALNHGK